MAFGSSAVTFPGAEPAANGEGHETLVGGTFDDADHGGPAMGSGGDIEENHFAANVETGLKPIVAGYAIKEVPISWINRSPEIGASSFRLIRVGGGHWRAL